MPLASRPNQTRRRRRDRSTRNSLFCSERTMRCLHRTLLYCTIQSPFSSSTVRLSLGAQRPNEARSLSRAALRRPSESTSGSCFRRRSRRPGRRHRRSYRRGGRDRRLTLAWHTSKYSLRPSTFSSRVSWSLELIVQEFLLPAVGSVHPCRPTWPVTQFWVLTDVRHAGLVHSQGLKVKQALLFEAPTKLWILRPSHVHFRPSPPLEQGTLPSVYCNLRAARLGSHVYAKPVP